MSSSPATSGRIAREPRTPPPGPRRYLPGSVLIPFRSDPTGWLDRMRREYGDVVLFRAGGRRFVLVSDPELAREVLVYRERSFKKGLGLQKARRVLGNGMLTAEGEEHARQRRAALPQFHRDRIAAYGRTMVSHATRFTGERADGEIIDVGWSMGQLTLAIVAETLFGSNLSGEAREIGEALDRVMHWFEYLMLPLGEYFDRLPIPGARRALRAQRRLDEAVYRIIRERQRSGLERDDLLQSLLNARNGEQTAELEHSDRQLRDEVITFFLAGHETTANALTWTWYLLSQNKRAEALLCDELRRVLGGRDAEAADVEKLRYTAAVTKEAMRLYPPAWILGREALVSMELGGYAIERGDTVFVCQWTMHRDARFYPEPLEFRPERWTSEGSESKPPPAFIPFGAGRRKCIGDGFATAEAVLLLATIARQWRMCALPGQRIGVSPLVTLRPKWPIRMRLERRELSS